MELYCTIYHLIHFCFLIEMLIHISSQDLRRGPGGANGQIMIHNGMGHFMGQHPGKHILNIHVDGITFKGVPGPGLLSRPIQFEICLVKRTGIGVEIDIDLTKGLSHVQNNLDLFHKAVHLSDDLIIQILPLLILTSKTEKAPRLAPKLNLPIELDQVPIAFKSELQIFGVKKPPRLGMGRHSRPQTPHRYKKNDNPDMTVFGSQSLNLDENLVSNSDMLCCISGGRPSF